MHGASCCIYPRPTPYNRADKGVSSVFIVSALEAIKTRLLIAQARAALGREIGWHLERVRKLRDGE